MSVLFIFGICMVLLSLSGRIAVKHSDTVQREKAIQRGKPEPKPSNGRKRAADAGTGIGILAIIASLLFGGGAGFGNGMGPGFGNEGNSKTESTAAAVEATYDEAVQGAKDGQKITISVHELSISFNGYQCADEQEFEKMMEKTYEDGMTIILVDDYADSAPFSQVKEYLKDKAYIYQEEKR